MSKEHYMHTCEVVDADTIVCQGMKFVKERTCKDIYRYIEFFECSECHAVAEDKFGNVNFCPSCGAKVVE